MAKILISGYYGFKNAGDEAILGGIITALRRLDPDLQFAALTHDPAYTEALHGIEGVDRHSLPAIWRAIGEADLVLSGGGSLLQDVTSPLTIPYYLGITTLAKLRGKPVMFYAQGVGPITTRTGRLLTKLLANRVDRIALRDQESADLLARLGVTRPPTYVTADAALALQGGDGAQSPLSDGPQPIIGVSVRPWPEQGYVKGLAAALDRLAAETGGRIVFLCMQEPQDALAAADVLTQMAQPAKVLSTKDYHELLDAIAACDVMIGMRYHALVLAALCGVPLVGLSYDPKNDSFLKLIGRRAAGTVAAVDPDTLVAEVQTELARGAASLPAKVAPLVEGAAETARLALSLLRGDGQ